MRRSALTALWLAGCYASHERTPFWDGGTDALDVGSDAHMDRDGGQTFCRVVAGEWTLTEPGVGCTVYDGRPIDLTHACVAPTRERIACEAGMADCTRAPRCVAQLQPDGTTRTFLIDCSWTNLVRDPSFTRCPDGVDVTALPECGR